jgi:hypothetical protein
MLNILVVAVAYVIGAFLTRQLCKRAFGSVVQAGNHDPYEPLPERVASWNILWSRGILSEIAVATTVTNGLLAAILAALVLQFFHW